MTTHSVIVDSISRQGDGNLAFSLVAADDTALPGFSAGAHIDVHLPNGHIRQYSLACDGSEPAHYLICVKKEPQSRGGSRAMHEQVRVGDKLRISPPRNLFPLQAAKHTVLIAAGIGITPLLAMAETLSREQQSFELHYYAASQKRIAFAKRLTAGFSSGSVHLWCSDCGVSPRQHLPEVLQSPNADTGVYLCGPQEFMAALKQKAQALGWQAAQLHSEAFAPVAAADASASASSFTLKRHATGEVFVIPEDKTIAQVLQENNVAVPLSCEMGICGACLTRVVSGEVDHRDSVQSEQEKSAAQQQIALCCSRSRSAELVVDI